MSPAEPKKITLQPEQNKPQPEQNAPQPQVLKEPLVKQFPAKKKGEFMKTAMIVFVIMLAGVATGYLLSSGKTNLSGLKSADDISQQGLKVGDIFGNPDEETFRDKAEGVLVKGGTDGEGSHHLLRPGGESQNVFLTSSIIDLDPFADHRVEVWGETFTAQKAGWLMDVGRVEVLELNAEKPFEEEQ